MGYNLVINGVYCVYNPLTNHVLTSWDIWVRSYFLGAEPWPLGGGNRPLSNPQVLMEARLESSDFGILGVWGKKMKVGEPGEQTPWMVPFLCDCSRLYKMYEFIVFWSFPEQKRDWIWPLSHLFILFPWRCTVAKNSQDHFDIVDLDDFSTNSLNLFSQISNHTNRGNTKSNMWCKAGVNDMILHCAEFLSNDEVAHLVDSINLKLGMTPEACLRWRSIVMS